MENKRKILVIENQFTQFKKIIKLLDTKGYQSFPNEETFKDYIDWIRIYLNPRYTWDRRKLYWEKILAKTIEFDAEVFIIDHILVGMHNAEDGIDLAMKFRENGITQPFIFFSRTDINSIDICDRLPKISLKKEWIFKGYSGAAILEQEFFTKEVIPKIEGFMGLPTVVNFTSQEQKDILANIKTGNKEANDFHETSYYNLIHIFGDRVCNPKKEVNINQGRKRIDIVFDNNDLGFFKKLNTSYSKVNCPKIFVECKNYGKELGNPEIDQLEGRFNSNRGNFGILICRSIQNKQTMIQRCKDVMHDKKGYIIVLEDKDINQLLDFKEQKDEQSIDDFLSDKFDELIM